MSDTLKAFVKNNSKFVDFQNQPAHKVKFIGYKVVPNTFDPDGIAETVEYTVEEEGVERTFKSQNVGLATMLDGLEGKAVTITRTGEGVKTKWEIDDGTPKE